MTTKAWYFTLLKKQPKANHPFHSVIEFMEHQPLNRPHNLHVSHPEWATLYLRRTWRVINGKRVKSIDLASLEAVQPHSGAFKRLFDFLRSRYPDYVLYCENILNSEFATTLRMKGWNEVPDLNPPCLYWLPEAK